MKKYQEMPKRESIEKNLVSKGNALIRASYDLSLNEERIILSFISMIKSEEGLLGTEKFEIDIPVMKELFYSESGEKNIYRDVKTASEKLLKRVVVLEYDDDTGEGFQWASEVEWDDKSQKLWIKFHRKILPFISNLKKRFTTYRLREICKFSSKFSIRIFELICLWHDEEKFKVKKKKNYFRKKITIEGFKKTFVIEKKFKEIWNFKKRVLNPAMAEINEKTRFNVSYKLIRKGRPYHWIEFTFSEKECFKEGRIKGKTSSSLSETEGELEKDCLIKELKTETQRLQKIISSGTQTENPSLKIDAYFRQSERFKRAWKLIFEKYGLDLHTFLEGFYTRSTNFENVKHFRNTLKKYLVSCLKNAIPDISNDEINNELTKHLN